MRMPERIIIHRNLTAIGDANRHREISKFDKTNPIRRNSLSVILVQPILPCAGSVPGPPRRIHIGRRAGTCGHVPRTEKQK